MLEIVICDSEATFSGLLAEKIKDFYDRHDHAATIRLFSDGHSFMRAMDEEEPIDMLFLNTKLSDMSGFVVADLVRLSPAKKNCQLVFLGGHEEVFQSFVYQPAWYIRKDFWEEELDKALNRLWTLDHRERSILIHEGRSTCSVRVESIQSIASDGHYLNLRCGETSYRIRGSMLHYEELLKDYYFAHPSKSYLVNCAYVKSVSDKVLMKDGSEIKCSKGRRVSVRSMLERYLREVKRCL